MYTWPVAFSARRNSIGSAAQRTSLSRTDLKDEDRKDFQALADAMNSLVAGMNRVDGLIGRNPDAVSDRFKTSFRNAFQGTDPPPQK